MEFKLNRNRIEQLIQVDLQSDIDTKLSQLVDYLIEHSLSQNITRSGIALAASFDFLVGLFYYQKINNGGWVFCPKHEHCTYYFPYVNVCPRCAIKGEFYYHKAGKSQSANIGLASIDALIFFTKQYLNRKFVNRFRVIKGEEPIDLIIYDAIQNIIFLCEVKSAPLMNLPLFIETQEITEANAEHETVTLAALTNCLMGIQQPIFNPIHKKWESRKNYFSLRFDPNNQDYFIEQLYLILKQPNFFDAYLATWAKAFKAYSEKDKLQNIFWLTGACGKPPSNLWKYKESISDGKTSVGMDRTDDIKKGVYQLLKLRLTEVARDNKQVKIGIVSNIHAARHHDDYLADFENLVWFLSPKPVSHSQDIPYNTPLNNLFDAIITFTKKYSNDAWFDEVFNYE